jgi:hypothetical protein
MKDFDGAKGDHNEDELQRVPEFMRASAYLDKREQQILQSQQAIIGLQRAMGNVMFDIAHLLAASPSAGNQAMLQRSFGELEGLANVVAQTAATAPSGGDSGASRGAGVDLTGTQAVIESRANSPSGSASKNLEDKIRKKAEKIKDLSAPDPAAVTSTDQSASGDAKPTGDTPTSNLDRFNKLAQSESRTQDGPVASASSDSPPLPNKPGSRSNAAALKLDHAEAMVKSDAPDRQWAQGVEPTAQTAATLAKAEPSVVAAVRKAPSPAGM